MTHVRLCAIHMIPAASFTFKRKIKEKSHCLEASKYSKSSTNKQLIPISCRCAEAKEVKKKRIEVC